MLPIPPLLTAREESALRTIGAVGALVVGGLLSAGGTATLDALALVAVGASIVVRPVAARPAPPRPFPAVVEAPLKRAEPEVDDGPPEVDARELLDNLGQDRGLLAELVALYAQEAPVRIAEMREALAGGDPARLARLAHRAEGTFGVLCVWGCKAAATRIKAAASRGDLGSVERELDGLEARAGRAGASLDELLKEEPACG